MKDVSKAVSLNFCLTDFFFLSRLAKSNSYTVLEINNYMKKKKKSPLLKMLLPIDCSLKPCLISQIN